MEPATHTQRIDQDYQLVCSARDKGDGKAYANLMHTYREPLYLLLLRMTRDANDAADLTMETFSKAFSQLHRYSPTSTFSAWLFSIGTNTFIDFVRKRKIDTIPMGQLASETDSGYLEYQVPSGQPNPEETFIQQQRTEELRQIVAQLKQPYRQIVELRYFEELSYEQIAHQLDIPLGTVKVRLARARTLMAAILNKKTDVL